MTVRCYGVTRYRTIDTATYMNCLYSLSACDAAEKIALGDITSEQLVLSCLQHIKRRDPQIHAWEFLDGDAALRRARQLDQVAPIGPLHGVPVGIKDIIETKHMPTTYGSSIYTDYYPQSNAECIDLLEQAGAVILGKTVTAEFATYSPGPTTNPRNIAHTPGGSSSGSAAAVADFQVPLAIGTQTAGSVIRPASFCGTLGFKPSKLRYSTEGVLETSSHLDTLGIFSRCMDDVILADTVLAKKKDSRLAHKSQSPVVAVCRTSVWNEASTEMQLAVLSAAEQLAEQGVKVVDLELPELFDGLFEAHKNIHMHEVAYYFESIVKQNPSQISEEFQQLIAAGKQLDIADYEAALLLQRTCIESFSSLFGSIDLLLTPSAKGLAPEGLCSTGDPLFNRLWTALGVPCLGIPWSHEKGMLPLGIQLVGRLGDDGRFLNQCRQLTHKLGGNHGTDR